MKKGKKLSEEHRKKISIALKGKIPKNIELFINSKKHIMTKEEREKRSIEYKKRGIKPPSRKGMDGWNKGKTGIYSEETRKSISENLKNYFKKNPFILTDEARKKIGESHKGEKSCFWKGGVSKINRTERENFMSSFEYQQWRRKIFERDKYFCQICNKLGCKLRAHHIKKYIDYPELRLELNNGITLCEECDCKKVMHKEKEWEIYFFENLKKRGFIDDINIFNK